MFKHGSPERNFGGLFLAIAVALFIWICIWWLLSKLIRSKKLSAIIVITWFIILLFFSPTMLEVGVDQTMRSPLEVWSTFDSFGDYVICVVIYLVASPILILKSFYMWDQMIPILISLF